MCQDGRKRVIQREISDESCFLQCTVLGTAQARSRARTGFKRARLTCCSAGGLQPTFAKADRKRETFVKYAEYLVSFADLSDCQLIQVPDAIYMMMRVRDIQLTACNLSSNVITKIPPKFPTNFNFITGNSALKFKLLIEFLFSFIFGAKIQISLNLYLRNLMTYGHKTLKCN